MSTMAFERRKRSQDELEALRVKVEHALQAMEDTFGEEDHRVRKMSRTIVEFLEGEDEEHGIVMAAAYSGWCISFPDEIVREVTRPCKCLGGWVEVEDPGPGHVPTVRPCTRCNFDLYSKYVENPGDVEGRIIAQHRREPVDEFAEPYEQPASRSSGPPPPVAEGEVW